MIAGIRRDGEGEIAATSYGLRRAWRDAPTRARRWRDDIALDDVEGRRGAARLECAAERGGIRHRLAIAAGVRHREGEGKRGMGGKDAAPSDVAVAFHRAGVGEPAAEGQRRRQRVTEDGGGVADGAGVAEGERVGDSAVIGRVNSGDDALGEAEERRRLECAGVAGRALGPRDAALVGGDGAVGRRNRVDRRGTGQQRQRGRLPPVIGQRAEQRVAGHQAGGVLVARPVRHPVVSVGVDRARERAVVAVAAGVVREERAVGRQRAAHVDQPAARDRGIGRQGDVAQRQLAEVVGEPAAGQRRRVAVAGQSAVRQVQIRALVVYPGAVDGGVARHGAGRHADYPRRLQVEAAAGLRLIVGEGAVR